MLLFVATLALAAPDTQVVQVFLKGQTASGSVRALDGEGRSVTLRDPGTGVLTGSFEGAPRRVMQLRLVDDSSAPPRRVYDALVMLTDAEHQAVAFEYSPNTQVRARRVPFTAAAHVDHHHDPRLPWWTALGWGVVAAVYTVGLGIAFAVRGR
jgi:hypothetical protein